jgi:hypothetical protein
LIKTYFEKSGGSLRKLKAFLAFLLAGLSQLDAGFN